ncbi:MAG: hypothetical protein HYR60_27560 [Acidobacteria bacterium]|nr:hypothetical protein [Acidobacteriota bacterium]
MKWTPWILCLCAAASAQDLKKNYLDLTEGWAREAVFTKSEQEAMERGRQWETLLTEGLDDPVARKGLAAGEPSFEALAALYPGKVLDRTLLGTWSDPAAEPSKLDNEFTIWWNGAISADLIPQTAHRTNVVFRVGREARMFGALGQDYSRIGYEEGYLPIVRARYRLGGMLYQQSAWADKPAPETRGWDIAYVQFDLSNESGAPASAELHEDLILIDGSRARAAGDRIVNASGAVLLAHSDPGARFDEARQRLSHVVRLRPGQKASLFFKIPYYPDEEGLVRAASRPDAEASYTRVHGFWSGLLARGARFQVPEERVNQVWRALLLQNFILADGRRFTYGSGLRYNDSYYPVENGFGAHTFATYGHTDYANALLSYCVPVSVRRDLATRKYQNRRGIPFHHLLENYRLSKKTDVFERYREDLYRAAEEIIADRRLTMIEPDGAKPLHWGFLPPDRPGVDVIAATQTVYVTAHNITSCQGLRDFGDFLVRTGIDPARGRRYLSEAQAYRKVVLEAMEKSAIRVPGRPPFVDLQTLYFRDTPEFGPEPYDHLALGRVQGTYYHYWADMQFRYNFFNPSDRVGQWIADYAAQRGGFALGVTRARPRPGDPSGWINAVYNAGYYDYRLRGGRREEFLLGLYSRLAFAMSRHVYVSSEGAPLIGYNTRNGGLVGADHPFPNSASNAETLSMLRAMLVLEELENNQETGDIWLLKGVPRAWLEAGKKIEVNEAPTYFGPLSFSVESRVDRGAVVLSIRPPRRDRYRRLVVTVPHPQRRPIREVLVNGRSHADFDAGREEIRLPYGATAFLVEVRYFVPEKL